MHRSTFLFILILLFLAICAIGLDEKDPHLILQDAEQANEKGNLSVAIEKYREALTILETRSDEHVTANALYKLGDVLQRNEETQNQKGIADTLLISGNSYYRLSEFEKAFDCASRSFEISTRIGHKSAMVDSLRTLGAIKIQQGEFERAMEFFQEAIPIAEQLSDATHLARVLSVTGFVYTEKGDTFRGLEYLNKSLEIHRKTGARQNIANCLYNIGVIYGDIGNYEKARDSAQEALAIAEEIGEKGLASVSVNSLAVYNQQLGIYDSALQYLEKAAQLAEKTGEKASLAYALHNVGNFYLDRGKYTRALPYYQKALEISEGLGTKRPIALSHYRLGYTHTSLGDHSQALQHFEKALTICQSIGIKPIETESYLGIGSAHYSKHELPEAEEALTKAIEISREIWYPRTLWRALHKKGLIYRDTGKNAEALNLMKESVEVVERVRGEMQLAEDKAGYFGEKLDLYEDLIRLLVRLQRVPDAFEFAQKTKARSFLDMLAEARIDPDGNIDPELKQKRKTLLAELVTAQKSIENEYKKERRDQKKIDRLVEKRGELDVEYMNLSLEVRKQNPRFDDVKYAPPLKLTQAQQLLDEQSALLEYSLGKDSSLVFVVTRNGAQVFEIPGEKKISEKIKMIREVLLKSEPVWETSEKAHTTYVKLAGELYEDLMQPAQSAIAGVSRIVIAPDGVLNFLPFECLLKKNTRSKVIDFAKLPYVGRDYEIHYIPSVSVLAAIGAEPLLQDQQKELLAFANPSKFSAEQQPNGSIKQSLPELPNAKLEVERIAALYPPQMVSVFLGNYATEKKLKGLDLAKYKKVHFASHGLLDEERPEFSALVLSTEAGSDEDGNLTMREVFDLNLKADLVVLSACKTGLGKQIRGEGVSGLSRAFLCAGTSRVLVSLWNVYDRSTADFMSNFYQNILKGKNQAAALKEARLRLIQSRTHSHPYYWAPFVLIGNN